LNLISTPNLETMLRSIKEEESPLLRMAISMPENVEKDVLLAFVNVSTSKTDPGGILSLDERENSEVNLEVGSISARSCDWSAAMTPREVCVGDMFALAITLAFVCRTIALGA
jgi:hypothetical protein